MNFVTHLECALCQTRHDANTLQNLCTACQRPLWVKYDLPALSRAISKSALKNRADGLWRYHEMLPMRDAEKIVSLGETMTPILETKRLASHFGVNDLWVKDESRLP